MHSTPHLHPQTADLEGFPLVNGDCTLTPGKCVWESVLVVEQLRLLMLRYSP